MSTIKNAAKNTTELVEQYIGTAYDKMAELHGRLDDLDALNASITELNNTWLGNLTSNPETRADGSTLIEGDRYYNIKVKATMVYSNGQWTNGGASITTNEVVTIGAGNLVGGDTVVTLSTPYTTGSNAIMVFVGAAYQYSQAADPSGSYVETDEVTITFPGVELTLGETVTVIQGIPLPAVNPVISLEKGYYIVETTGQTVVPLPDGMDYVPNASSIEVYKNGLLQVTGLDYEETNSTTITSVASLTAGDIYLFKTATLINNETLEVPSVTVVSSVNALRNNLDLDSDHAILVKGGNTLGDGSGGLFVYDATYAKSAANGYTVVDATQTLLNQGSGIGNGCWVRQYEGEVYPEWFNSPNKGMAALQDVTPVDGDEISIQGFYEDSYVGGGRFVYDASADATTHNGGTIISPQVVAAPGSAGWYTAPGSGTGCWIRIDQSEPNVYWWGVTVDGITNYDAAFTAIDAYNTVPDAIRVPPATYVITGTYTSNYYSIGPTVISGGATITIVDILI